MRGAFALPGARAPDATRMRPARIRGETARAPRAGLAG